VTAPIITTATAAPITTTLTTTLASSILITRASLTAPTSTTVYAFCVNLCNVN
jgi:hypothetical protein